jgi:glycine/D-amino acid oxidase-like deaminating enzyme
MREVTVIGAGIAGLTAAITAAQQGARVRVLEERAEVGGRARTTPPPYVANLGPHALYSDGEFWQWLEREDLLPRTVIRGPGLLLFRHHGEIRPRLTALGPAVASILSESPPADQPFGSWAGALAGDEGTELLCALASITTFDADAARLSAAFVHERIRRSLQPDVVRYVVGGWRSLVARLVERASDLGVTIETRHKVTRLPRAPVVVATTPAAAARLVGQSHVRTPGPSFALRDLVVETGSVFPVSLLDVDERLYLARYTAFDRSLAPPEDELIQIVCCCRQRERFDAVQERIDRVLDGVAPGWRERLRWSRRSLLRDATGAIDLPGQDWRDRPAIVQGSGCFLAGDYVAAPGLLSEVSFRSGALAGAAASEWLSAAASVNIEG